MILGLAAFGLGLAARVPHLRGGALGSLFMLIQVSHRNVWPIIGATVLIECLAATLACTGSRLRKRSGPACPTPNA